ncbi:MAG: hypothetical protein QM532_04010 [Cyanobium sp. MAG06]|nr:hypothetical protein [Cyanobium sp. MAG06]
MIENIILNKLIEGPLTTKQLIFHVVKTGNFAISSVYKILKQLTEKGTLIYIGKKIYFSPIYIELEKMRIDKIKEFLNNNELFNSLLKNNTKRKVEYICHNLMEVNIRLNEVSLLLRTDSTIYISIPCN